MFLPYLKLVVDNVRRLGFLYLRNTNPLTLIDEGDISNYLGVNINTNSDGTFELLQYHLEEKIINHVGPTVYTILTNLNR